MRIYLLVHVVGIGMEDYAIIMIDGVFLSVKEASDAAAPLISSDTCYNGRFYKIIGVEPGRIEDTLFDDLLTEYTEYKWPSR